MKIPASQLSRDMSFLNGNAPLKAVPPAADDLEVVIRTQFTLNGAALDDMENSLKRHPTLWEAVAYALRDLGEAVGKSKEFRHDVEKNTLFGYGEATDGVLTVQASAQLVDKNADPL